MSDAKFKNIITDETQLREIIGHAGGIALDKAIDHIDSICEQFISTSPFVLIASADAEGNMDISPKGDPAGFVQVYDRNTLLIPDRPGNRRADTLSNILQNNKVSLFFMVPNEKHTLRVIGTAQIVRDDDLRQQFAIKGKLPLVLIAVTVQEAYFHCTKCMVRSNMWDAADNTQAPSFAKAIITHAKLSYSEPDVESMIEEDETTGLY